jgi:acetyl esterase/lipase
MLSDKQEADAVQRRQRKPFEIYDIAPFTGSAVVYAHGGGLILASVDLYAFVIAEYVAKSGVPFLAVEYRLAPEGREASLAEDVLAGLRWLVAHAPELGVEPSRIASMGDSGSGCPAAVAGAQLLVAKNPWSPRADVRQSV